MVLPSLLMRLKSGTMPPTFSEQLGPSVDDESLTAEALRAMRLRANCPFIVLCCDFLFLFYYNLLRLRALL